MNFNNNNNYYYYYYCKNNSMEKWIIPTKVYDIFLFFTELNEMFLEDLAEGKLLSSYLKFGLGEEAL